MKNTKALSTAAKIETAILVAVSLKSQDDNKVYEYLNELDFLARTLNLDVKRHFYQKLDRPDSATFVGTGKLTEIQDYVEKHDIDWVIFDDELSPSQVKNINNVLKRKIYDRSLLILDIFMQRAKTAQAKTQVELAKHQYLLPRLTRMWTHLERQRGGTGTRGGAGEKEIETDRRIVKDKISLLKERLEKIDKTNALQRKARKSIVRVAIVGYTNVGKSTLMNTLTKADVLAENKLFATVDATVRKMNIDGIPFLLSDTVGFIRKLPHQLIECFKSTLDEVREADILMHVADFSHPTFEDQLQVVTQTLAELRCAEKPTLLVCNKMDQVEIPEEMDYEAYIENLQKIYAKRKEKVVFISAQKKHHVEALRHILYKMVSEVHYTIFPHNQPESASDMMY